MSSTFQRPLNIQNCNWTLFLNAEAIDIVFLNISSSLFLRKILVQSGGDADLTKHIFSQKIPSDICFHIKVLHFYPSIDPLSFVPSRLPFSFLSPEYNQRPFYYKDIFTCKLWFELLYFKSITFKCSWVLTAYIMFVKHLKWIWYIASLE